jgi:DNA polymerase-4
MRAVWNGIVGERYYHWIRGEDLEYQFEVGKSIGHSNVLSPEFRTQHGAYAIAIKMLHKTAYRLRESHLLSRRLSFSLLYTNHTQWGDYIKLNACNDTHTLNDAFQKIWKKRAPGVPLKVSVTLSDFIDEEQRNFSFFDDPKKEQASRAMDLVNKKYGKHLLYLADMHETRDQVKGKIAFSSLPKFDID